MVNSALSIPPHDSQKKNNLGVTKIILSLICCRHFLYNALIAEYRQGGAYMDLYSFITDNVPRTSPKEQTQAGQGQALFNGADVQASQPVEAEAFSVFKGEFLNRISDIEKRIGMLKNEQNELEARLRVNASAKDISSDEAAALLNEKSLELDRLKTDIALFQQESRETLFRLQNLEKGNQRCIDETEKLAKDCTVFKKETQRALVIACIATVLVIAGLFIYFSKRNVNRQIQETNPAAAVTTSGADHAAVAAWPRNPIALNIGDFRISLSPLEAEAANKLAVETANAAAATHSFYNLEVRAKQGVISSGFLKAPAIDFIDKAGTRAKSDAGADLRVINVAMSGKLALKKGTDLFSCVVLLKKDFQPVGIVIGGLNKRTRMLAIYA